MDHPSLIDLLAKLPAEQRVQVNIHTRTEEEARAVLVAAEAVYGELPEPRNLNPHTYILDVGPATIFLPATFVEEEPEPRPEPKVRPMADLLAGA